MPVLTRARILLLSLGLAACGGGGGPTPPSETPVASVSLSETAAILIPTQSVTLTASPRSATGALLAGRPVTWTTGSAGVATVSATGVVTATGVGTTQVTATSGGKSASATIEVREGAMIGPAGGTVTADGGKLAITIPAGALSTTLPISVAPMVNPPGPPPAYGTSGYELGPSGTTFAVPVTLTFRYQTTGLDSLQMLLRVKRLTNGTWLPLEGSVTDGLAGTVSAPTSSFSHYYIAHARFPTRIVLSPATGGTLYVGQTTNFSMTVWDQHNQVITPADIDNQLIWGSTSWNSGQGLALSAAGGSALVTAVSPSGGDPQIVSVIVSANAGCTAPNGICYLGTNGGTQVWGASWARSVTAGAFITVVPVPVRSVTVVPAAPQVTAGGTIQLQATPRDSIGGALPNRPVTWTSGDATRATVDANGLVSALAPGTVTITATSEGVSGSALVTIVGSTNPVVSVEVTGPASTVEVGGTLQLTAVGRDASNGVVTGQPVTWISLDPAVASVSPAGLVTGLAPGGPVGIRATIGGVNRTVGITVTAPVPLVRGLPAANDRSSCLLRDNGTTWCWGHGASGELGAGTTPASQPVPAPVTGAPVFVALALGGSVYGVVDPLQFHACGLTGGGQVWCWGKNRYGQLGDNSTSDRTVPVTAGGSGFTKLFTGMAPRTCALQGNGDAFCWGASPYGHNDPGTTIRTAPTKVVSAPAFTTLALAQTVSCGLDASGAAFCWGSEGNGELGDGDNTVHLRDLPHAVAGGHQFTALAGGDAHFCGLKADGSAWCWGRNTSGQLGDGTTAERNAPVAVQTAVRFTALAAGPSATCGIALDQSAWCWGVRSRAGAGIGVPDFFVTPTAVPLARSFSRIALGGHGCADTTDGIWCWGNNQWGQLGNGSTSFTVLGPVKVVFPQ